MNEVCQCGHFVKNHALKNGHSHKSTQEKTGACGCVFSRKEALDRVIANETIYDTFSTLLLGTGDSIADAIKVSPFEDISPRDVETILYNSEVGRCAACGTWADLDDEHCEMCAEGAW